MPQLGFLLWWLAVRLPRLIDLTLLFKKKKTNKKNFLFNVDHLKKSFLNWLQYCFCFSCFGFLAVRHVGS